MICRPNDNGDRSHGDAGNDTIYGGDGNDTIEGGAGSDTIDGGAGIDTAVFAEDFSSLSIIKVGSTYYVSNGTDLDTITGVENFSFNGHTVNLTSNPDALDQTKGPSIDSIVESGYGRGQHAVDAAGERNRQRRHQLATGHCFRPEPRCR